MSHDLDAGSLTTSDGVVLEAEAWIPDDPIAAVVLTHPHPDFGGSMYTPVPEALYRASRGLGVAALRFNFRGTGRSGGSHDAGRGEQLDVIAAVDALRAVVGPDTPLLVGGWSFGADVALSVATPDIAGWLAVAPPLQFTPADRMAAGQAPAPKVLAIPEHDQFRVPDEAATLTAGWVATTIETIPGNDHYLASGLPAVIRAFQGLVERIARSR